MTARQHQVLISPTPADMNFDTQANRIMRLCKLEASLMKSETIEPIHVLLAILKANDNEASDILQRMDITYDKVQASPRPSKGGENGPLSSGEGWGEADDDEDMEPVSAGLDGSVISVRQKKQESKTPALDSFGTDLTQMAAEDLLDPVIGREKEIERVAQILNRRKKNNPILIGEPGVGKSAIVEGLAQRIIDHRISRTLWNKRLVVLDLASVVAGTKYRGQFEERLRCIMMELKQNPDVIVFIDEIHTLIGAGNASGSMDAANMLKPALSRGEFQCIGDTTLDEFRKIVDYVQQHISPEATFTYYDTICRQVANRMPNIRNFALKHDAVLFVCGKKSSNGRVLFNECKEANPRSYMIDTASEIDVRWLQGCESIGICGATSTPKWLMEECKVRIEELLNK